VKTRGGMLMDRDAFDLLARQLDARCDEALRRAEPWRPWWAIWRAPAAWAALAEAAVWIEAMRLLRDVQFGVPDAE